MAKQIKFFSQTAVPTGDGIDGNVYFVNGANNGNEIYKGAVRFGAPRVTKATTNAALSAIAGMIRGDINVGYEGTKVYDGQNWIAMAADRGDWIGDINDAVDGLIYGTAAASSGDPIPGYNLVTAITGTSNADGLIKLNAVTTTFKFGDVISYNVLKSANVAALADLKKDDKIPTAYAVYNAVNAESTRLTELIDNKASKGTGNATGAHGVSGTFTLKSNSATHDFTLDVKSAALATNFSTSDYFTTGSIVYGHTSGLAAGDNKKYINKISYDAATGKLSATASATVHDAASIANADSTSYTLTDVYAVKSYVESKISGLGNVMEFKGVIGSTNTYLSNAKVGDVVLVGAAASSKWYWDGSDIASSGTSHVQPGQEFVCVSVNTSSNIRTWELIGDQNAQTTILGNKAQTGSSYATLYGLSTSVLLASDYGPTLGLQDVGVVKTAEGITADANVFVTASAVANLAGASTSNSNGVTVSVSTKGGKIDKVLVAAPAYTAASSTANNADNGVNVAVSTVNGQVKAVDVVVSEAALATNFNTSSYLTTGSTVYAHTSGLAAGGNASYIQKIAYSNGKLTATAVAFPSYDYNPNAVLKSDTSNGTTVSITTQNGHVTKVEVAASNWTPGNGASTSTSYGVTISASTVAGVQKSANITVSPITTGEGITSEATTSLATAAAIAEYVYSAIDGIDFPVPNASTSAGASKGVSVTVDTDGGMVTNVTVSTTLQTTIATTNTDNEIPSAKAVSNALCWYKQDGTTLW